MESDLEWLDAPEAADLLGVKRESLYAYVSRGQVRSTPVVGSRQRRYFREDIERLRARRRAKTGHGPAAAGALRWGEPVLDSSITAIRDGSYAYRGHDAVDLAQCGATFEGIAELLWTGAAPQGETLWRAGDMVTPSEWVAKLLPAGTSPFDVLGLALHVQAVHDTERYATRPQTVHGVARRILRGLCVAPALLRDADTYLRANSTGEVAAALLVTFGLSPKPEAVTALRSALILCADHELNSSSFAARVAASTGADLYACVSAALSALSGPGHGKACERVEALVREIGSAERVAAGVRDRLARGDTVPGFGHTLYPDGDPRAAPLIELATKLGRDQEGVKTMIALRDTLSLLGGERPNLDFGLVALTEALGMPAGSGSVIFAVGRAAGWVAHVLEQRDAGFMLRPRARYVGS